MTTTRERIHVKAPPRATHYVTTTIGAVKQTSYLMVIEERDRVAVFDPFTADWRWMHAYAPGHTLTEYRAYVEQNPNLSPILPLLAPDQR